MTKENLIGNIVLAILFAIVYYIYGFNKTISYLFASVLVGVFVVGFFWVFDRFRK